MALLRFPAFLLFVARRLLNNPGLLIGAAVGLLIAVTLAMSVPLYAEAADFRLLREELSQQQPGYVRPPFAFKFRYSGIVRGAIDWQDYQSADPFFKQQAPGLIGLPLEFSVRHVTTGLLRVYPLQATKPVTEPRPLDFMTVGFVSDLDAHIQIVEGRWPPQASDAEPIPLLVMEEKANEVGFQLNEELIIRYEPLVIGGEIEEIRGRVAAIWRPADVYEAFWFDYPRDLLNVFLVPEQIFAGPVVSTFRKPVAQAVWYHVYDGSSVRVQDVEPFIKRIVVARNQLSAVLANAEIDLSPERVMRSYIGRTDYLTILLYVFAIPIVCVIAYFIVFLSNLVVYRQRHEIAVLRSRGLSRAQIVGLYLLERVLIGAAALALGVGLAQAVAQAMGAVQSFLLFSAQLDVTTHLSRQVLALGLVGIGVSLLASLAPALGAAGQSIISHKQEVARTLHRPWWQRAYVDIFLLAIAVYGYYMLRQRGTLSFLGRGVRSPEGDPFRNPILFLVPTLFVMALALIAVRLIPAILEIGGRVRTAPLPVLLSLRQLGRTREQYTGPLLLIVLTLGLACFTASMAKTLDQGLIDQAYYAVGADIRVRETGRSPDDAAGGAVAGGISGGVPGQPATDEFLYFPPVSERLRIQGVQGAARLATHVALVRIGNREQRGTIVGIDRQDFQSVGFFRSDFAPSPLGSLMNRLALDDSAVLVQAALFKETGLAVGDTLLVRVIAGKDIYEAPLTIAGVSELFPTVYPNDNTLLFVANLDYLYERMGREFAHDVLLRVTPETTGRAVVAGLYDLGIEAISLQDARQIVQESRSQPERQGILGLLSVGFVASAVLTVLGYLFYALLSFQRRSIEFGVLRAIGLSPRQMTAYLGFEQALLVGVSMAAGTGVGVLTSRLFIPFLQVRSGQNAQIPPFIVDIAWTDLLSVYAVFGLMFVAAFAGLVWLLGQMRIATAIKMGEMQ